MLVMGLGNLLHKQAAKGLVFLAVEILYLGFMFVNGFHCLAMLPSLGSVEQEEVWNETLQIYEYTKGDNSVLILLYGVATILLTGLMICFWAETVRSAYQTECLDKQGRHVNTFREDLRTFLHENIKKTADDSADGIYLRADDSAADLYDLYGFYKLQQNWQPSGIV